MSSVSTSVEQRTWDLGVTASVGSLTVNDYYTCVKKEVVGVAGGVVTVVEGEPEHLLSTGDMGKQQLLSFEYNKVDLLVKLLCSTLACTYCVALQLLMRT